MNDKEADLIVKRSRSFALLCALILILVTVSFLISYFSLPTEPIPDTVADHSSAAQTSVPVVNSKGRKLFKANCAVCHTTTDQKLTGPGLAGMADRLPKPAEKWFSAWVLNNEKMLRSGDAYAKKVFNENGKAAMTVFEGQLSEEEVHEIYVYITEEANKPIP